MAKRREQGTGSIYEDRSRRWTATVDVDGTRFQASAPTESEAAAKLVGLVAGRTGVKIPQRQISTSKSTRYIGEVTINGKRRRVSGRTKTDVSAKLRALTARRDTGLPVGDARTTVRDAAERFLEREIPNRRSAGRPLAPGTVANYRVRTGHIIDELGAIKLAALTVEDVEAMLDRLHTREPRPYNAAGLRVIRNTLAQILEFAERRGHVSRNVARLATLPPEAAPSRPRRALQPDDARTLLRVLRGERYGAMYALSLRLGLRPGEAAGILWEDLNIDDEPYWVNVTHGRQMVGGQARIIDDLKTAAAKRTLALPADLAAWLREHRQAQRLERLAARRWDDERLVFASVNGRPVNSRNANKYLARICQTARVPMTTPNELRHSCASLLADEGVSNEAIADLLGHTTTRMVERTYKHRLRPVIDTGVKATWAAS